LPRRQDQTQKPGPTTAGLASNGPKISRKRGGHDSAARKNCLATLWGAIRKKPAKKGKGAARSAIIRCIVKRK